MSTIKHKPTSSQSLELAVKSCQNVTDNEMEIKIDSNEEKTKENDILFKCSYPFDFSIIIILIILGIISVTLIYLFRQYNKKRYCIITAVSYIISISLSISLNADDIKKKKKTLILSIIYSLCLLSLSIISTMDIVSISGYITISAVICSYSIIIVIFCYQRQRKNKIKQTLKYLWNIKGLLIPILMHFADIATDIGSTMEYYSRSISKTNELDIPYSSIFKTSIFILIFYRFIGAMIVFEFTRSTKDAFLQFIEVYIIKTLMIEWKMGYTQIGRVHKWLNLIESIFESGPQAIISMYIIYADSNNSSIVIWFSSILSILSIAIKTKSQDDIYFSSKLKAKEIGWNRDKIECGNGRCIYCHWRYVFRILWRLIDVTSFILLCTAIWYHWSGLSLFIWLIIQMLAVLIMVLCFGCCFRFGFNMHWINAILACSVTDCKSEATFALAIFTFIRFMVDFIFAVLITVQVHDVLSITILVMICWTAICYALINMMDCRGCCGWKCGENWVDLGVMSSLTVSGCRTKEEIYDLIKEGVNIKPYLTSQQTWQQYPRPIDLIHIADELNVGLKARYNHFERIGYNGSLDPNHDVDEIQHVIERLKEFSDIGSKEKAGYPIYWAVQNHSNTKWIHLMLTNGAYCDYNECVKEANTYNRTSGKDEIIKYLQDRREE